MAPKCDKRFFSAAFVLVVIVSLFFAACVSQKQPENMSSTPVIIADGIAATTESPGINVTQNPQGDCWSNNETTVERGNPFTITGKVINRSVTAVEIWVINQTYTANRVPVEADGTFTFVIGPEGTSGLPRTWVPFSAAFLIQYPNPPDNFTITLDRSTGRLVVPANVPSNYLPSGPDYRSYTGGDLAYKLSQLITKFGGGNSCDLYFVKGVDASITLDPVIPSPAGTMIVSGSTSLPAGTPLYVTLISDNYHPMTAVHYDYSNVIAEGNTTVQYIPDRINRYTAIVNTSLLNTGHYSVIIGTNDINLQASTNGFTYITSK